MIISQSRIDENPCRVNQSESGINIGRLKTEIPAQLIILILQHFLDESSGFFILSLVEKQYYLGMVDGANEGSVSSLAR
jgi:hypothetical protein